MSDDPLQFRKEYNVYMKIHSKLRGHYRLCDSNLKKNKTLDEKELKEFNTDRKTFRLGLQELVLKYTNKLCEKKDVEDILWRYCYYKQIELYRKEISILKAKVKTKEDLSSLRKLNGGFLHFLDQSKEQYTSFLKKVIEKKKKKSVYRCFLFLGDLARYREIYDEAKPVKTYDVAKRYYEKAIKVNDENGNPHNQLAVLAQYQHNYCSAMYHYLKSIEIKSPFETSPKNLSVLFETVMKKVINEDILNQAPVVVAPMSSSQRKQLLESFLLRFVYLSGILLQRISTDRSNVEIEETAKEIIKRNDQEMTILIQKWALKREMLLALIVTMIHVIGQSKKNNNASLEKLAQEQLFQIGSICIELLSSSDFKRKDLLGPLAVMFDWIKKDSKENKVSLDLHQKNAIRIWKGMNGPIWEDLLLPCARQVDDLYLEHSNNLLWEEKELSGFLPLSYNNNKKGINLEDILSECSIDSSSNAPGENEEICTQLRAFKICSFCDWLSNECGYADIFEFETVCFEREENIPNVSSAALSSATSVLLEPAPWDFDASCSARQHIDKKVSKEDTFADDNDNMDVGGDNRDDWDNNNNNVREEEEEEEDEVIVLAPHSTNDYDSDFTQNLRFTGISLSDSKDVQTMDYGVLASPLTPSPPSPPSGLPFNQPALEQSGFNSLFPGAFTSPHSYQQPATTSSSNGFLPDTFHPQQSSTNAFQNQSPNNHDNNSTSWNNLTQNSTFTNSLTSNNNNNNKLVSPADFLRYLPKPIDQEENNESTSNMGIKFPPPPGFN